MSPRRALLPSLALLLAAGCDPADLAPLDLQIRLPDLLLPPPRDLSVPDLLPPADLSVDDSGPPDLGGPDLTPPDDLTVVDLVAGDAPHNPMVLWLSYQNFDESDIVLIDDPNPPLF